MIGVKSHADKAIAAAERNRIAAQLSARRLQTHDAAKPGFEDADRLFRWKRERAELEDRLAVDQEVLAHSEQAAARAEAEIAERSAAARHAAEDRQAEADRALVMQADKLARDLAAKLAAIEASRERTAEANRNRGGRAFIPDCEERVRKGEPRTVPATYSEEYQWVDRSGNRASQFVHDKQGRRVPAGIDSYEQKWVKVKLRNEYVEPAIMPERLAEAITLVDLAGRQIWPAR